MTVLETPGRAPHRFRIDLDAADGRLSVSVPDRPAKAYPLPGADHAAWLDLYETLAGDFGLRVPLNRQALAPGPRTARLKPVLTEPISPDILYGYGDPSVLKAEGAWYLAVTSNDAPNAFPILRSDNLEDWTLASFAFPEGAKPAWTLHGPEVSDFWAPELHRVGEAYWLVFTARERDGALAIGLATSQSPEGPFAARDAPLLSGGVIDSHVLIGPDGAPILFWKEDSNHIWPGLLAELLHERAELIAPLFPGEGDRRTAAFLATLQPWTRTQAPMERFFVLQPLIEAATDGLPGFEARLGDRAGEDARPILAALKTRIYAQRLAPDGAALVGERQLVLQNDQPWEAHLIEGVWVTRQQGRYYLFYAANDFSTPHYGIGAAVAEGPLGPYRKLAGPLLGSTAQWAGPGHPSVAPGPDGRPRLFLHAFFPGALGYKAFRAVLSADLEFTADGVRLGS